MFRNADGSVRVEQRIVEVGARPAAAAPERLGFRDSTVASRSSLGFSDRDDRTSSLELQERRRRGGGGAGGSKRSRQIREAD